MNDARQRLRDLANCTTLGAAGDAFKDMELALCVLEEGDDCPFWKLDPA